MSVLYGFKRIWLFFRKIEYFQPHFKLCFKALKGLLGLVFFLFFFFFSAHKVGKEEIMFL